MNVSDYEFGDFESALLSGRRQRNWLWFGLIVSLTIHLALCTYFYRTRFQSAEAILAEGRQPPMFKVRNVDLSQVDKNSNADQNSPAAKLNPDQSDQQPDEKKSFDKIMQDVQASTAMPDDMSDVLPEQPKVEQPDVNSVLNEIERSTSQALTNNPNATHEQSLLNDSAVSGRPQPALTGTELATSTTIKRSNTFTKNIGDSAGPSKDRPKGFSDLDQLLAQKGPLGSGTKLRLPDDQVFQYNSAELQSSAVSQLQKLGTLIKRNPKATFSVEGYTDSFGPPDYNLDLSQRRADSVKQYLVEAMGINPAQIETRGYGQSKFLVQPRQMAPNASDMELNAEIDRQQPNRRVVIVVRTSEGQ
ncbi:MAG: OmpA family protein [Verrucomicrobiota bacterium]|nr:OmpA family protein [Verrucomicrobiota bacterium]